MAGDYRVVGSEEEWEKRLVQRDLTLMLENDLIDVDEAQRLIAYSRKGRKALKKIRKFPGAGENAFLARAALFEMFGLAQISGNGSRIALTDEGQAYLDRINDSWE